MNIPFAINPIKTQVHVSAVAAAVLRMAIDKKEVVTCSGRADDLYRHVCASMGHPVSHAGKFVDAEIYLYSHRQYAHITGKAFDWRVPDKIARTWADVRDAT